MIQSKELEKLEKVMKSFEKPWFVAGGWTIDLMADKITREHEDMDICIFREDAAYTIDFFQEWGWDIKVAVPGEQRLEPVTQLSDISPPRYCLHLFKGEEFLEVLFTERTDEEVVFRKNRDIRMPLKDFSKQAGQLPFINPAWQLLFKGLSTRSKDEQDFKAYMNETKDISSQKWLLTNLKKMNGNRKWIEELSNCLGFNGNS